MLKKIGFILMSLPGLGMADISIELPVFSVNFNELTPGSFLNDGGSPFNEPSDLDGLEAEVVEVTTGENLIHVQNEQVLPRTQLMRWDFLDGDELTEGGVTISFDFTPSALDAYALRFREGGGGSTRSFLNISFGSNGVIFASDENGVISVINNTYQAQTTQHIDIVFDLEAGLSSLNINGHTLFTDRAFGVDDRGIGSFLIGYFENSGNKPFTLDNIVIEQIRELPLVLDADFENKSLGDPIGEGGPELGEPISIPSIGIDTEVVSDLTGNQGLLVYRTPSNSAKKLRWEFLNEREETKGIVVISAEVVFEEMDKYSFSIRENGLSGSSFNTINFSDNTDVSISDANGVMLNVANYQINTNYLIKWVFDMDMGSYDLYFNDNLIVDDRQHGVTTGRGVGSILTGFHSISTLNASFVIDNIQVGVSALLDDIIFESGFDD